MLNYQTDTLMYCCILPKSMRVVLWGGDAVLEMGVRTVLSSSQRRASHLFLGQMLSVIQAGVCSSQLIVNVIQCEADVAILHRREVMKRMCSSLG